LPAKAGNLFFAVDTFSLSTLAPYPSAVICSINSLSTRSATSFSIWQVPALSCPPQPEKEKLHKPRG
jgi:hypothetical protein